jgi:alanine-glyoxylate transaminase/serine-glyoxylate transaminase/serine-pyruvate transaminase
MGPGPSDVPARVLQAMARPTIGHLDPDFVRMMDEVKELLRYAFRTKNALTMPISGPGSAGMEACFVNLVEPGDEVLVCRNGVFGGRMASIVERCGGIPIVVEQAWGRAIDPDALSNVLDSHPRVGLVAFVHAETSTGAASDAKAIADVARAHDCLTLVDAVTSLGGSPLEVDGWKLDAVYSGSQKCLSCTPGLSPVTFSERALDRVRARTHPVQSWFFDLNLVMGYWAGESGGHERSYHHTAPINALYGLHEALVILREEGIENAWERHRRHHLALRAGLEAMGLSLVVPEAERLPQLNAIGIPAGVSDAAVRGRLLEDFDLEIGGGLGDLAGKVWRVGLMGASCRGRNVLTCLAALELALAGTEGVRSGVAVAAAREQLA